MSYPHAAQEWTWVSINIHRAAFQSSSCCRISLVHSGSLEFHFLVFSRKAGALVTLLCLLLPTMSPISTQAVRRLREKQATGVCPIFLGPNSSVWRGRSSPISFRCLWVSAATATAPSAMLWLFGGWGLRERKLSVRSSLFWNLSQTRGCLWSLCLCSDAYFWISDCLESWKRLITGSVLLQILVFSFHLPDPIYLSESLNSCFMHSIQVFIAVLSERDRVKCAYSIGCLTQNSLFHF